MNLLVTQLWLEAEADGITEERLRQVDSVLRSSSEWEEATVRLHEVWCSALFTAGLKDDDTTSTMLIRHEAEGRWRF